MRVGDLARMDPVQVYETTIYNREGGRQAFKFVTAPARSLVGGEVPPLELLYDDLGFEPIRRGDRPIGAGQYRAVLIELTRPVGDSVAVPRRVRAARPQAHVALVTGFLRRPGPLVGRLIAEGAEAVFDTPFDVPRPQTTLRGWGRIVPGASCT